MSIYFNCEDVDRPELRFDILIKALKSVLRINNFRLGEINYIFCSDSFLLALNVEFLNHDYFTDVITFDYTSGAVVSGDVYISTERVMNNSVTFEQLYEDELVRVVAHGLLHLLGFNDKKEEEICVMRKAESGLVKKYLEFLGKEH
jgi:probable rRNA maturation factor